MIHATAVVDPRAEIASSARVGAYAVIGPEVVISEDVEIRSHVVLEGPTRIGEGLAMLAAPFTDALLHGSLRRYRSIPAETVARAIVAAASLAAPGQFVHENDAMQQLAD